MKKIFLLTILLPLFFAASGQNTFQPKQLDEAFKGIIYNQETAFNVRLHTNGFAFGLDFGKIKTYYQTKYLHIELGELKHNRETRQSPDNATSQNGTVSRAFKFGKKNNLYTLRVGYGTKRYFSEKAKRKGVSVGLNYEIGPTLGLIKPYYIELRTADGGPNPQSTKYSEEVHDRFLDVWSIHGSSGWTRGLDELSVLPGVHGKISVHFDWGAFDQYVKAVEAGIMLDVFSRKAPIMVETEEVRNRAYFLNLFLNLQFGKRW